MNLKHHFTHHRLPALAPLIFVLTLLVQADAWGLAVTNLADAGPGTLRQTIADEPPGGTIDFAPELDGQTIGLSNQLMVNKNLTIDARTLSNGIVIDAQGHSRVMDIPFTNDVTLLKLTITGGKAADGGPGSNGANGGGIRQIGGLLTLSNCVVSWNSAGNGGDNRAGGSGGGIFCDGGRLMLSECEITDNNAGNAGDELLLEPDRDRNRGGDGGGIFCKNSVSGGNGSFFVNCHILRNRSGNGGLAWFWNDGGHGGGVFFNGGIVYFEACTIANNATGDGGDVDPDRIPASMGGPDYITSAGNGGNGGGLCFAGSIIAAGPLGNLLGTCSVTDNRTGNGGGPNVGGNCYGGNGGSGGGIYFVGFDDQSSSVPPADLGAFSLDGAMLADNQTGQGGNSGLSAVFPFSGSYAGNGGNGGGVAVPDVGSPGSGDVRLQVAECTIFGNATGLRGTAAPMTLQGNDGDGGGIYRNNDLVGTPNNRQVTLNNSIVAHNTAAGSPSDMSGDFVINGTNLVMNVVTGAISGAGIILAMDPRLAPLGDYGGANESMPPLPDSPAIDRSSISGVGMAQRCLGSIAGGECYRFYGDPPEFGLDGNGDGIRVADIGSVEFNPAEDLARYWPLDWDGDGNAFGVEHALGTDPLLADAGNARKLRALGFNGAGDLELTFGFNQQATNHTRWILRRTLGLNPATWSEVYRYDGPTATETIAPDFAAGFDNPSDPTAIIVSDENPPGTDSYYRFESLLVP